MSLQEQVQRSGTVSAASAAIFRHQIILSVTASAACGFAGSPLPEVLVQSPLFFTSYWQRRDTGCSRIGSDSIVIVETICFCGRPFSSLSTSCCTVILAASEVFSHSHLWHTLHRLHQCLFSALVLHLDELSLSHQPAILV